MPPIVPVAVRDDTWVSNGSPGDPIDDPLSVALCAVTLSSGPLGSINAPVADNVTARPAAVTEPTSRSPMVVMLTAPPVADADVRLSVLLLDTKSPPPAP